MKRLWTSNDETYAHNLSHNYYNNYVIKIYSVPVFTMSVKLY